MDYSKFKVEKTIRRCDRCDRKAEVHPYGSYRDACLSCISYMMDIEAENFSRTENPDNNDHAHDRWK